MEIDGKDGIRVIVCLPDEISGVYVSQASCKRVSNCVTVVETKEGRG